MKFGGLKAILVITFILLLVAASAPMEWDRPLFSNDFNNTITSCSGPYVVQPGESLSIIATRCGITVSEILANNQWIVDPNAVLSGQQIFLPGAGNFAFSNSTGAGSTLTTANSNIPVTGSQQTFMQASRTHIVVAGDTLGSLAQRYGTSIPALLASNPQITNPNLIYINQVLTIPSQ